MHPSSQRAGPGSKLPARHGLTDQEAAQADAQEEAQEAAEAHALAAPPAGPLSPLSFARVAIGSDAFVSGRGATPRDTLVVPTTGTRRRWPTLLDELGQQPRVGHRHDVGGAAPREQRRAARSWPRARRGTPRGAARPLRPPARGRWRAREPTRPTRRGAGTDRVARRARRARPTSRTRRASTSRNGGMATRNASPRVRSSGSMISPRPRIHAAPPREAERHVGSDLGRDLAHAVVVDVDLEQAPHREQRGGRVGRAATEPGTGGDLLAHHESHAVPGPTRAHDQLLGRDEREVGVIGRDVVVGVARRRPRAAHHRVRALRTPRSRRGADRATRRARRGRGTRRRDGRAPAATA